jgi:hypothetical protein
VRRRSAALVVGVAALVVAGVVLAATVITGGPAADTESGYGYHVTVETTATVESVTLLLPLPVRNGAVPAGRALVAGEGTVPVGWDLAVVGTRHGPMLRVRADALRAAPVPSPGPDEPAAYGAFELGVTLAADGPVAVRRARAAEPVLVPRYDETDTDCPNRVVDVGVDVDPVGGAACSRYEGRLFADYEAPANASLSVVVHASGWTRGTFGRRTYRDVAYGGVDRPGWTTLRGQFSADW